MKLRWLTQIYLTWIKLASYVFCCFRSKTHIIFFPLPTFTTIPVKVTNLQNQVFILLLTLNLGEKIGYTNRQGSYK